jgi:hypothetical protein
LLSTPYGPPVEQISPKQVVEEVARAEYEDSERAQFCPQVSVGTATSSSPVRRTHLRGQLLFVEMAVHVLLPLAPG